MKKRALFSRLLLAGLLAALLAGCGKPAAPRNDFGSKDFLYLKANPGRASVVFLREWRIFEADELSRVFEDKDAAVGAMGSGCYRVRQAQPGDHVYWIADRGRKISLPLSLKEGDIVFVTVKIGDDETPGALDVVSPDYAKPRIADMPGQCPSDPYKNWIKKR